jgi:hypothetical protein
LASIGILLLLTTDFEFAEIARYPVGDLAFLSALNFDSMDSAVDVDQSDFDGSSGRGVEGVVVGFKIEDGKREDSGSILIGRRIFCFVFAGTVSGWRFPVSCVLYETASIADSEMDGEMGNGGVKVVAGRGNALGGPSTIFSELFWRASMLEYRRGD